MKLEDLPRVSLAHLPTPLEEMARLSEELAGPRIFIKRDDQTGLATGGNKVRKLEFVMADALTQGADIVITPGGAQSNHARLTAAAAVKVGLKVILLLTGQEPTLRQGNLLLDDLLGAQVWWTDPEKGLAQDRIEEILKEIRGADRKPYFIPAGASTEIGIIGYVLAMKELLGQLEERELAVDYLVSATGTGGTQTGLVLGAKLYGYEGKIIGISVSPTKKELTNRLKNLAEKTIARWQLGIEIGDEDFIVYDDYVGGGYGVMGPPEVKAIRLLAQSEGILLDPIYTGRAMAGLIDLIRRGTFAPHETVLFWHTGGTSALFAYAEGLMEAPSRQ